MLLKGLYTDTDVFLFVKLDVEAVKTEKLCTTTVFVSTLWQKQEH